MDEQGTPTAATATPEEETTATPPAITTQDIPLAAEPDVPPPAQQSENDSPPKHDDDLMQLDEDSIAVAHPRKDAPEDAPDVSQPEPDQLSIATPQPANVSTPTRGDSASARGSRSNKRVSFPIVGVDTPSAMTHATPTSAPRGRPPGRPRGSRARGPTRGTTRGNRGGRGGKRKRADDDDDGGDTSDSETYAPTTTKSGRNVQKPTTFVPPPQPSPPPMPSYKKKRTYRRNPESAVCKICLRGVSPASNMIVFCDGCNVPYHRYCHQPPIDQSVIDEVDKEWYCKQCERERIQPVPESHVVGFVSVEGASAEEVCVVSYLIEYSQLANTTATTETKVLLKSTARPAGHTAHKSNNHTSRPTTIRPIIPTHRRNHRHPANYHERPHTPFRSADSSSASNNIPKCGGLRRRPVRLRRAPITLPATWARADEHITSGEE